VCGIISSNITIRAAQALNLFRSHKSTSRCFMGLLHCPPFSLSWRERGLTAFTERWCRPYARSTCVNTSTETRWTGVYGLAGINAFLRSDNERSSLRRSLTDVVVGFEVTSLPVSKLLTSSLAIKPSSTGLKLDPTRGFAIHNIKDYIPIPRSHHETVSQKNCDIYDRRPRRRIAH
jgi:hypothetical protein